jgi:hypothetical protein
MKVCELYVERLLEVQQVWSWGVTVAQVAIIGAGALVFRKLRRRWRERKLQLTSAITGLDLPDLERLGGTTVRDAGFAAGLAELPVTPVFMRAGPTWASVSKTFPLQPRCACRARRRRPSERRRDGH